MPNYTSIEGKIPDPLHARREGDDIKVLVNNIAEQLGWDIPKNYQFVPNSGGIETWWEIKKNGEKAAVVEAAFNNLSGRRFIKREGVITPEEKNFSVINNMWIDKYGGDFYKPHPNISQRVFDVRYSSGILEEDFQNSVIVAYRKLVRPNKENPQNGPLGLEGAPLLP